MVEEMQPSSYVHFKKSCGGQATCVKVCPTKAIRLKSNESIQVVDHCIGCGECIRVCPKGAVSAATNKLSELEMDQISVALVSPVLYSQFPGVMPKDILLGLKQMGFLHTVDMSYFLEMFQCATEEFIVRNRADQKSPWPLISPVCPVVVRLIAYQFPTLLPHVIPVLRPVALMAREVKKQITREYGVNEEAVTLYYINPCPTSSQPSNNFSQQKQASMDKALGINDIYAELIHQIEKIRESDQIPFSQERFEFENCATGNGPLWGLSGGEIADMNIDHSLAVSGLKETITYLEKIELGLFRDMEYIEFRVCPEGCIGGVLTVIDKYLAKSAVQKMVKMLGLGKRLSRNHILRLYEKGWFHAEAKPSKLQQLFGAQNEPLSIESLQEIERLLEHIQGINCAACGAPDCRTFAEDVVRGMASLNECLILHARGMIEGQKT